MQTSYLIKNATLVNEGKMANADVRINYPYIETIDYRCDLTPKEGEKVIDASNKILIPGLIDDQVHFREPGLTHKGNLHTESRAAVAGGITTFMEMPNTVPNTLTQVLLEEKYALANRYSLANYSFFMGASNDNLEEVLKTNPKTVCGVKIFMGSSTGNMLVDQDQTLEKIFSSSPMLIATHCEDEKTVRQNLEAAKAKYGENATAEIHPIIRNDEACYLSSSKAIALAKKHNTRLHILHISTAKELDLFESGPLKNKRITAEVCVHHLWFSDADYKEKGNLIKWNPAIKSTSDRDALWNALLSDKLDIIATDHAPHTIEEKAQNYWNAPSGGPLVQHALLALLQKHKEGKISLEKIVEKACHAPAECFQINKRGYIREGYYADLVLIDPNKNTTVQKDTILALCKWSPFEGTTFNNCVEKTFVNGHLAYNEGVILEGKLGQRIAFDRD